MDSADISKLLDPLVAAHGLEIDRLEVVKGGKRAAVQVFLDGDGPEGMGPSIDQISAATRSISDALDVTDVANGRPYTLEVSSRGVGRPLTEPKHFRRNQGRLVVLTTADGELVGRIVGAEDDSVELDIDGVVTAVALGAVSKALVQIEMNRPVAGAEDQDLES
jgi:ribosome maturation factor RimP